jgi:membrane peptidoglycan carboxypeptidase
MQSPYATRNPRAAAPHQTTTGWLAMIVFAFLAALGGLFAIALIGIYIGVAGNLKDPGDLDKLPVAQESTVYDRTGKVVLASFGLIHRQIVEFKDIPPVLVDATTAVEDRSFWTNSGFDPAAIVSAGLDAFRGNPRGASTITQQLVRARLLDPDLVQDPHRTIERKLEEIIQSIRLTKRVGAGEEGKQKIIAAYLNQNFYGNNSYGVAAAAQSYFGVPLNKLTLAQAAILAALPQSPSHYDLVRNAELEKDGTPIVPDDADIVIRRNRVLDAMAAGNTPLTQGKYAAADFAAAKQEPVVLAKQVEPRWIAPHFIWALREELTRRLCGEQASTCDELEQGGFHITSTLDAKLQTIAEKWVGAAALVPKAKNATDQARILKRLGFSKVQPWMLNLRNKDINNGALVAVDYQTGQLVAYVGSAEYYEAKGTKKFQPKFDVVGDGWRQPGSAFKPFNYVTGIDEHRLTAGTMLMDVGTDFGGNYTPTDADSLERGPVRVRTALQFSLNIPAVKAMAINGVDHVFERAQDYGLRFRSETSNAGLAFALGVQEVRPVDLVTGYGTIANGGQYVEHTTIIDVKNPDGSKATLAPLSEPKQAVSTQATGIITDILAGNTNPSINPFWGKFEVTANGQRRPATLKTGTNNDAKDLNAYGFIAAPDESGRKKGELALAVGVWNGNSDNSVVSTPQRPVFSIDVSTFVWQGFMNEATRRWKINDFTRPEGLVQVRVDPWTGLRVKSGERSVTELFIRGTEPQQRVGSNGGVCGQDIIQSGPEAEHSNWMAANRDWLRRAARGPGVRGGPDRTRTAYFYNGQYMPYGRSWGPLLGGGGGCETPPPPSCIPQPTPDASGVIPPLVLPSPSGSGPIAEPCPTRPPPTPTSQPSIEPSGEPTKTPPGKPSIEPSLVPSPEASPFAEAASSQP